MMKLREKNRGFTMIEMIITIGVLSFGILGLFGIFYPIVTYTYNVSMRFTAANLAQEGLEIVGNIRDTNFIISNSQSGVRWYDGLLSCQAGCQLDYKTGTENEPQESQLDAYNSNEFLRVSADGLYGYGAGENTPFQREIIIERLSTDVIKVTAIVRWDYNNQPYSFTSDEYLYNWY